jgi:peptide/nickel transport system permease protein
MRVADIQLSFPPILIALVLLAISGPGVGKIILALITVQWAYYARTARSAALVERGKEYIEAAVGLGLSTPRIVLRHLLPNCLPPLIVVAALQVASAITLEATLSFLGLGLPVTEPSLGLLISNGFQYLLSGAYWISVYPGIALLVTVAAINLVADQLRDVLNPRLQGI